jgi:hypothetical protein
MTHQKAVLSHGRVEDLGLGVPDLRKPDTNTVSLEMKET